jgi:chromosome segregation ATPase
MQDVTGNFLKKIFLHYLKFSAELDRKKLEAEAGDLRKKLDKAERDLAGALADRDALQDRLARANADLTSSNARRIQAEKELNGLRDDLDTALKVGF